MSLIACPVCGNQCSSFAYSCPQCGHPFRQKASEIQNNQQTKRKSNNLPYIIGSIICLGMTIGLGAWFYNKQNQNSLSNVSSISEARVTINLKAALVYKLGGAQPISRTEFYLVKEDLKVIAAKSGKDEKAFYTTPFQAAMVGEMIRQQQAGIGNYIKSNISKNDKITVKVGIDEEGIKDYIVQKATTNFEGNAKFENVPIGTYYIVGLATTRKEAEYVVWSVKVDTEQTKDTVLLDQENAYKVASF